MSVRCVVTGHNQAGKSVFAIDTRLEPVTLASGFEVHRVWGGDSQPHLPSDGTSPPHPLYFPPESGFRFGFFTIPPDARRAAAQIDVASAVAEMREKLPGLFDVLEPKHPRMHTTDTVDFAVILSGEVYLELDDGAEVLLKAGDCVVQNGTRHAWHNRSTANCVVAFSMIGARRVG